MPLCVQHTTLPRRVQRCECATSHTGAFTQSLLVIPESTSRLPPWRPNRYRLAPVRVSGIGVVMRESRDDVSFRQYAGAVVLVVAIVPALIVQSIFVAGVAFQWVVAFSAAGCECGYDGSCIGDHVDLVVLLAWAVAIDCGDRDGVVGLGDRSTGQSRQPGSSSVALVSLSIDCASSSGLSLRTAAICSGRVDRPLHTQSLHRPMSGDNDRLQPGRYTEQALPDLEWHRHRRRRRASPADMGARVCNSGPLPRATSGGDAPADVECPICKLSRRGARDARICRDPRVTHSDGRQCGGPTGTADERYSSDGVSSSTSSRNVRSSRNM